MSLVAHIFSEVKEGRLERSQAMTLLREMRQEEVTAAPVPENQQRFDALLLDVLMSELYAIDVFSVEGRTLEGCLEAGGIRPVYRRWLAETVRVLQEQGYLRVSGEEIALAGEPPAPSAQVWAQWQAQSEPWLAEPALQGQMKVVEPALRELVRILRGEVLATDVLFPRASMHQVEGVYRGNPVAEYFNTVLAEAVVQYVRERLAAEPSVRLRLLEVGAGTGGTSATVLARLDEYREHIEEYRYTDLSRAFLLHAQQTHGVGREYVSYGIYNAEREASEQSLPVGHYDVVIAANVLHATREIRQTLRHVKQLLCANGLLVMNELSRNTLAAHLSFGLLQGWWLYEDAALRMRGCPGVSRSGWQLALHQEGYLQVRFPAQAMQEHGQQTIVALSDGVIRECASALTPSPTAAPTPLVATPSATAVAAAVPSAAPSPSVLRAHIERAILESLSEALRLPPQQIAHEESFADYGVDSITGGHVVQLVNRALGTTLPTTRLFDYSSVSRLTEHVLQEYGSMVSGSLSATQPPAPVEAGSRAEAGASRPPATARIAPSAAARVRRVGARPESQRPAAARTTPPAAPRSDRSCDPIAIIGMSGRFPGSRTVQQLWEHLQAGRDLIGEVSRWDLSSWGAQAGCRQGGFMDGIDEFDPLFFNISGVEAPCMDPQQRLFLQEAWHALEDAGYAGAAVRGRRCGVYVGYNGTDHPHLLKGEVPAQAMWGNSSAILSARIAYYLDLQGPAITIDTACSSSLVAMHLGCQGLWGGETELALAGGVYVHSTPQFYVVGGRASMLSGQGRCFTFDERADGFVPGEGVGVVVLKRLSQAQADGDHIYGVIRGSGINQDGTTNGITAPSARSQERLEREVYERFGIDPRQITLVEAHGTGTKLGDPIEYEALSRAFDQPRGTQAYCALGSIKTNIGHTLAAAGVAGVIKVLLSLQHRQIAPSLHYEQGNRHIDFAAGPFYVNTALKPWEVDAGQSRVAAVSSFGFSGTNAHMVIEEAPAPVRAGVHREAYLMVLSGRTAAALREQASQLAQYSEQHPQVACGDMSFTLLVGRGHFAHRLACVASDARELSSVLRGWLGGTAGGVHTGQVQERERVQRESLHRYAQQCLRECVQGEGDYREHLQALAQLYVQGHELPYEQLLPQARRLSLPTYPFARERYWAGDLPSGEAVASGVERVHPLLHRNTSHLGAQRYSSRFSGTEFFLRDHLVHGRKLMPAAAYLEMIRAAVCSANDSSAEQTMQRTVLIKDLAWIRPFALDEDSPSIHVTLGLTASPEEEIHVEVHGDAESETVFSRGFAKLIESEPERLDLQRLLSCCEATRDVQQSYAAYRAMGINHGPALQGMKELHLGREPDGRPFVLARLALPESSAAQRDFVVHPCIMDSAFQASFGLMPDAPAQESALRPIMPFAVGEVRIHPTPLTEAWVWITGHPSSSNAHKIDLKICDTHGTVAIDVRGLMSRFLEPPAAVSEEEATLLAPVWDCVVPERVPSAIGDDVCVAFVDGTDLADLRAVHPAAVHADRAQLESIEQTAALLRKIGRVDHIIWMAEGSAAEDDERIISAQEQGVLACFRLIKALLHLEYGSRNLKMTVVTRSTLKACRFDRVDAAHASIHGLIGSLAKEQAAWQIRLVDLNASSAVPWDAIGTLPADPAGSSWAYRAGEWLRAGLVPCSLAANTDPVYRHQGVYVVIGGAGGIGEVFSEHVIRSYDARVVWLGRRAEDEDIRRKRARLGEFGTQPEYIQADATSQAAMSAAYERIKSRFGHVHGVVHSAIVLLDRSLANMDESRFRAALAAKVDTCVRLEQTFCQEPLDFVLFFSGLQSFGRMPGQSNYAAACTFKDAFAQELAGRWGCAVKTINWGYWGHVGIVASDEHRRRMSQAGIGSIEPEEGMQALAALLSGPFDQLGFVKSRRGQSAWGAGSVAHEMSVDASGIPSVISGVNEAEAPPPPQVTNRSQLEAAFAEFDTCLAQLLRHQLLHAAAGDGDARTLEDWRRTHGIGDRYRRWLEESVRDLRARGFCGEVPSVSAAGAAADLSSSPWEAWDAGKVRWAQQLNLGPIITLVEATLRELPAILRGQTPATDVLFPRSSVNSVAGVYKGNVAADYFNEVLGSRLVAFLQERVKRDPQVRIRILEIGAGTGGTSALMFDKLSPWASHVAEYCYTDLSKAFLLHAQEHYASRAPYLKYTLLDAERSPLVQGMAAHEYDVVIATNVLHATKNIRHALRNAKALLRRNGLLLVNEITAKSLASHLTFGLLEGWWRFEDEALRVVGSPCLSPEAWKRVLEEEGFHDVSLPAAAAQHMGQQVFVGESDGIVRVELSPERSVRPVVPAAPKSVPARKPVHQAADPALHGDLLQTRGTHFLKALVAQTLQISAEEIDSGEPLERYGIDSILVVKITDVLKQSIPGVTSTLLFEQKDIDSLVRHLIEAERDALTRLVAPELKNDARDAALPHARQPPGRPAITAATRPLGRAQAAGPTSAQKQGIAIIGLSGRYPKARNVEEFWENLETGRDCIAEVPAERWSLEGFYCENVEQAVAEGRSYCKVGGFLEGFAEFDPTFFNISPREAFSMDPQERLFMQSCWEVLEDAGYTRDRIARQHQGNVGVFVGITKTGFELYGPELWQRQQPIAPRTSFSSVANRVSYFLDLHGPSVPVDTMCSASLTALHLACEHLLRGECEVAIAGGVNLYLHPSNYITLCGMKMVSPSGRCRTFGSGADGMVPGEGVGTVLIKPLADAERDGDYIYGVIRATTINHGGKTNGYTVPNPQAQRDLVRRALDKAGVHARAVTYLEAHGTGTELGDPIEISGLKQAFERDTSDRGFCTIGSVKTNIGHAESAAGIAGLTKVLMQMKHRTLAPSLHAQQPNPHIDFASTPFVLRGTPTEWRQPELSVNGERKKGKLVAGVSSFGAGGSNAHVLVEEYAEARSAGRRRVSGPAFFVLSARDEQALQERARQLLDAIQRGCYREGQLADVAYSLQVGREPMEHRLAIAAESLAELGDRLQSYLGGARSGDKLWCGEARGKREEALAQWADSDLPMLWVAGAAVDWERLYADDASGDRPRRIPLPTYPFRRTNYWIHELPVKDAMIEQELKTAPHPPASTPVPGARKPILLSDLPVAAAVAAVAPATPAASSTISPEELHDTLASTLADALYLERSRVLPEKPFAEMGLDSIVGVEWVRTLNRRLGLQISAARVYDYPNLALLSDYLLKELHLRAPSAPVTPPPAAPSMPPPEEVEQPAPRVTRGASQSTTDRIAIVGMSARYPGADNLDQFWVNLAEGRDSITEVPESRWDVRQYFDPRPQQRGKIYSKWLGALRDVDCFDPLFFGISPLEANIMDPQQRLFLQEAYRAFENAGYNPRALSESRCGVYLGMMGNEYVGMLASHGQGPDSTGNSAAVAAARIAYFLNLKGPAIAIDTVCSSSLVATHLACQALRAGEVDMALAGGVTLYLTPGTYMGMCAAGMLSPRGRCAAMDDGADGFVPGEGVGALVLKRLSDAEADGDFIYGVIAGSGINQDGRTNGLTAPSGSSQQALARDIYERYGVHPESISYVELHGTGTKLGDPVELDALRAVFREKTARTGFCALGSVKSNIGHTSAAAGVAGVHKVLLSLAHRQLVPTLHFESPNEHFDFESSPFFPNTSLRPWETPSGQPRRAAVSSFGLSGTNAHLVIDEYVAPDSQAARGAAAAGPAMIILSAKDEARLRERAKELLEAVESAELCDADLSRLAFTLQTGRESMEHRLAFIATSIAEVCAGLRRYLAEGSGSGLFCGEVQPQSTGLPGLGGDEDIQVLVMAWAAKGKFANILSQWAKGLPVDFAAFHGGRAPQRLPLPSYPFARERYWFDPAPVPDAASGRSTPIARPKLAGSAPREQRLLRKQWQLSEAADRRAAPRAAIIVTSTGSHALGADLARHFERAWVLDLSTLEAEPAVSSQAWESFDAWIDVTGCACQSLRALDWIPLLQKWIALGEGHRIALCVTSRLERHDEAAAPLNLSGALHAGLFRALSCEYARVRCRHLDTDLAADDPSLPDQILDEICVEAADVEVSRCEGKRFAARLGELPAASVATSAAIPLSQDSVLWITGGTRGLGAVCAEHFVRQYGVRKLVLSGRQVFPPRSEWSSLLAQDAEIARKIRFVESLEAAGAVVRVSSVDLADEQALRAELAEVHHTLGPVAGVLHCAGIVDLQEPVFVRKRLEQIAAVLEPKVRALDSLIRVLGAEPLQFFVLFSSVSAVVPALAVGQSDYAAANAYMDYVAQAHGGSMPIVSIQWSNWKDAGFGEVASMAFRNAGLLSQTNAEGLDLLDRVISGAYGNVVLPAIVDLARWQPARLMEVRAGNRPLPPAPESTRDSAGASLASRTSQWLRTLVCAHLRMDERKVRPDVPLVDIGLDSIMLAQLLLPIGELVGERIDPSLPFEYPTLESLGRWLAETYPEALARAFAEGVHAPATTSVHTPDPARAAPPPSPAAAPAVTSAVADTDIAVIGLSCHFPGAETLEEYWQLLADGRSAIGDVPADRGTTTVGYPAALLESITEFDPKFFQIGDSDAAVTDPQAFLLLEEATRALCHAGFSRQDLRGKPVGVYIGARGRYAPDPEALRLAQHPVAAVGQNYLAANLSRFFDFVGPSLVIDTACSSSLVAMNVAIQALRSGEITTALVGAVSVLAPDTDLALFEERELLKGDREFHIFDERAKGTIFSEGAGAVLLKPLAQALRDGDTVHAVIKSIAVNNDGRTLGPAAPSGRAQREVMASALRASGLRPEDVSYIDVSGAGSEVRDLLELKSIESVYRPGRDLACQLGSMKPNIGHPMCAEGIASFIKVVLMLKQGKLVPFLSARQSPRHYALEASPFRFAREVSEWPCERRIAGINSFADGGTNVHVLVEAAPDCVGRPPLPAPEWQRVNVRRLGARYTGFWSASGASAPVASAIAQ